MFRNQLFVLALIAGISPAPAQTWTHLSPSGSTPPGRDYFSAVYHPVHNRLVVFGGELNYQSVPTLGNDVWVLTNADASTGAPGWQQLSPGGTLPAARADASVAYDVANNRLILFGGNPAVGYCGQDMNDVWVLTNADGATGNPGWTQLSPTGGPPSGRAHNAMAYDPVNNRAMIFGGNQECSSANSDFWVLSNANGLGGTPAWTQLSPSGGPAARSFMFGGYDVTNNLFIVSGGSTAVSLTNDTWVLSHANGLGGTSVWSLLSSASNAPPRSAGVGCYDPASDRLFVFGGNAPGQTNDGWQLSFANGLGGTSTWTKLTSAGGPPSPREGPGGFFNAASHSLVVYGGLTCNPGCSTDSDVWSLAVGGLTPALFSFSPTNGVVGATVTINGTNFSGAVAVRFNGVNASFTVNSNTQITATVPAGASSGPLSVVTPVGTAASSNAFVVVVVPPPGTHPVFNGNFVLATTQTVSGEPWSLASADVYADGRQDLLIVYATNNAVSILTNAGGGTFSASGVVSNAGYYSVVPWDMNGDGKTDLVFPPISIMTNTGAGSFSNAVQVGAFGSSFACAVADVNGDGLPDLIGLNFSGSSVGIYTNNNRGGFNPESPTLTPSNPMSVVAADMNKDGALDLLIGGLGGVAIYTNTSGSGHFVHAGNNLPTSAAWSFAVADVNGDGLPDVILPNSSTNTVTIWTNSGGGILGSNATYVVGNSARAVVAADVNNDGWPDVIVANSKDNTLTVLTNTGTGNFVLAATLNTGTTPYSVLALDVNHDGGLDLMCANFTNNTINVFTNAPVYPPILSSFTPGSGGAGDSITMNGANFTTVTNVLFNGTPAAFAVNSDTQLTAIVPSCAGSGPITVFNAWGTATTTNSFTFTRQTAVVTSATEANFNSALCNGSNITFAVDGTIYLSSTKAISADTVFDGNGHNIILSGSGSVGIFYVNPGTRLTLKNLTLAAGLAVGGGGAIYNNGGLVTLWNCSFSNNVAVGSTNVSPGNSAANNGVGGAICNLGTLIVNNSTFFNNGANGGPGTNGSQATVTYGAGTTGGMGGGGIGGAIYNSGYAFITNATFYANYAYGGTGGTGGRGYDGNSYTYVCGSYPCGFSTCYIYCTGYNYVGGPGGQGGTGGAGYGGNLFNDSGNLILENVTCAGGGVTGGSGGSGGSSGNYNTTGTSSLGNGSNGVAIGGNLGYYGGFLSGVTAANSILGNPATGGNFWGSNYMGGTASVTDAGHNLSSDNTVFWSSVTSFTNLDPNLGPLSTNGGPTLTLGLLPGSPAVRQGGSLGGPLYDQRGQLRKMHPDIGAFETPVLTSSVPVMVSSTRWPNSRAFQIAFTNLPADSFSVWFATNVATPFSNWVYLGDCLENPAGQFYFLDHQNTNQAAAYYRVQSP